MFITEYSIFQEDKDNGVKESTLSKYILVFVLIISLSKGDNDGNVLFVECIFNIDMKPISGHSVQATPVGASDRARELAYQAKYIIRKLHRYKGYKIT